MWSCDGGLSSSTPELVVERADKTLTGERLAELLSVIADARDFPTAATFLVAQFADAVNARRGCVLVLNSLHERLEAVAAVGFDHELPGLTARLDDRSDPFTIAALSLHPVSCQRVDRDGPVPLREWEAIPFPQPAFRGAPHLLSEREVHELKARGCKIHETARDRRRRLGHAPFGVVVLETTLDDSQLAPLAHAASLAGPLLSRMFAVEESRKSAERVDQQRHLLSAIINSLPDPIIITDAANDIVVQNRRAEHLLSMGELDSEGRRRAVKPSRAAFGRSTKQESRRSTCPPARRCS